MTMEYQDSKQHILTNFVIKNDYPKIRTKSLNINSVEDIKKCFYSYSNVIHYDTLKKVAEAIVTESTRQSNQK